MNDLNPGMPSKEALEAQMWRETLLFYKMRADAAPAGLAGRQLRETYDDLLRKFEAWDAVQPVHYKMNGDVFERVEPE